MSFKNYLAVVLLSLCSVIAMAQNKRISGKVVDANGDPVIGAGITHVGTTNGVITDADGNFVFNVPDGATINVEALGFDNQQFTVVAGQNVYNVTLGESSTELDETVVIGYGTQPSALSPDLPSTYPETSSRSRTPPMPSEPFTAPCPA